MYSSSLTQPRGICRRSSYFYTASQIINTDEPPSESATFFFPPGFLTVNADGG